MAEAQRRPAVPGPPPAQGLYDPAQEHDACGVGFVVDIKGRRSHTIVRQALSVLINLLHRGACGCEANTGDGAGILIQIPDKFLRRESGRLGIPLPPAGEYGCGLVFLPRDPEQRDRVRALLHSIVDEEGQHLLGWREVPADDHLIGASALSVEPHIMQVLIGRGPGVRDHAHFERKLYVIRKLFEKAVVALDIPENKYAYMPSLSSNTRIAISPTTARSTRCAATSTGCVRARPCAGRRRWVTI
jgi:glutamate synthase domain-containing protein 1